MGATVKSSGGGGSGAEARAPFVSEFLGTFLLVFSFVCILLGGNLAWAPTAIGLAITALTYSCRETSGGVLNPAVALTLGSVGRLGWKTVAAYSLVQVLAGVSAGACAQLLFGSGWEHTEIELLGPRPDFGVWQVMTVETIYSAVICFVYVSTVSPRSRNPDTDRNQFYALAVGFAMIAATYGTLAISGACLNPAVTLALFFAGPSGFVGWTILYLISQVAGAFLAATLLRMLQPSEFGRGTPLSQGGGGATLSSRLISEFLGAYVLVLTFGLNVATASPATCFAVASALGCMVYSLQDVSGAHFNPAVTLGYVLSDREQCTPLDGLRYVAAQLTGGIFAALLTASIHIYGPFIGMPLDLRPNQGVYWLSACILEFLFTALLVYAMLSITAKAGPSKTIHKNHLGLAVGGCMLVGGAAIGFISGAPLNPAAVLGMMVANILCPAGFIAMPFWVCMMIGVSELLGGALAVILFKSRTNEAVMIRRDYWDVRTETRTYGTTIGSERSIGVTPGMSPDQLFDMLDRNHDGVLTRDEIAALAQRAPQSGTVRSVKVYPPMQVPGPAPPTGDLFDHLDTNHDGKLSPEEFSRFASAAPPKQVPPPAASTYQPDLFDQLDTNHDGKLSPEEYARFQSAGPPQPKRAPVPVSSHQPDLFDQLDSNHDGKLSPQEFARLSRG